MPSIRDVEDVDLGAEMPWVAEMAHDVRTYLANWEWHWDEMNFPLGDDHVAKYGPGNEEERFYERRLDGYV
ncbi:hypothetical protein PG990_002631 [Apiospora arundinis]